MVQETLTLKTYSNYPDFGCSIATNYMKKQSSCIECPFKEGCVKDIKYSTRVLLQSHTIINQVHESYNQGLTTENISRLFDVPLATIQYWVRHKIRIQKLLTRYAWAIQYLS